MKSKPENRYYYEGESERNFIKSFAVQKKIANGKVMKANFWEIPDISRVTRTLKPNKTNVFVVFDTDVLGEDERFTKNILSLSRNSKKLVLLPQKRNFEEEIAYACGGLCAKDMPEYLYRCKSLQDLKKKLAQDNNLFQNLISKGLDVSQMWSRLEFEETLNLSKKNIVWGVEHILVDG